MSSYTGVGFISKWTTKNIFISNVLKAFDNEISLLGFANPIDILNQCFDNYEKEFCFDIKIDEFEFTNIILQIEKGELTAHYDIIDIFKQQALLFDIDIKDIGLDKVDEYTILFGNKKYKKNS